MLRTYALRRTQYALVALVLGITSVIPLLLSQNADAANAVLGPRQIRMSTSEAGDTNASYRVKFRITSDASDLGGVVVAFCEGADTPIINDTACTVPTGFSLNGVTVNGQTDGTADEGDNTADITSLTSTQIEDLDDSGDTDQNTLTLTNATAVTAANIDANDYVAFTINGVDNPSTTGTFYARIYTYTTEAAAQGYTLANPDVSATAQDAGGIALSTAAQITVTAKVQERLVFCVYTTGAGNDCTGKSGTAITLGDDNGVLSPSGPFVNKEAKYSVTTNAAGSAIIRAKAESAHVGSNSLASSASVFISPVGSGTAEAAAVSAGGSEQFGFCTYESATIDTALTIDTDYDGTNGGTDDCADTIDTSGNASPSAYSTNEDATFAFITSELGATYGSSIATKPAGNYSTGTLAFMGNISNTTEAGIYNSVLTFIATGTY